VYATTTPQDSANPPRIVIHVGPHKTGTTFLQTALGGARHELVKDGILYPSVWLPPDGNLSHALVYEMLRDREISSLADQLDRVLQTSCHTVIISTEALADLAPDQIRILRELTRASQTTVVIYCRSWVARMASGWRETVRHGSTWTLPEFFADALSSVSTSNQISFNILIKDYAREFGSGSIRLACYDKLMERGVNLAAHFLRSFCGWTGSVPLRSGAVYESMSAAEAEIARSLNVLDPAVGTAYALEPGQFEHAGLRQSLERHMRTLRVDEADPLLRRIHDEVYAAYAGQIAEPHPDGCLFELKQRRVEYVSDCYMLDPVAISQLSALRRAIEARLAQQPAEAAVAG
jgi:hypothetical protein